MIKLFHVVLMKPDLSGAKLKLTHSYLTQIQTEILNSTHFLWVETDAFEALPVYIVTFVILNNLNLTIDMRAPPY